MKEKMMNCLCMICKLVALALGLGIPANALAAKAPGGAPAGSPSHYEAPVDDAAPLVAVYLSIKQPEATFVLASSRQIGASYRKRLLDLAQKQNLEILLPVVSDILQEAMTAVRIAVHDSRGLRNIAAMQGAKTVLAGRLQMHGKGDWSASWSIDNELGRRRWRVEHLSFDAVLSRGLDATARVLSGELAVAPHPLPKLLPLMSEDRELKEGMLGGKEYNALPAEERLPGRPH